MKKLFIALILTQTMFVAYAMNQASQQQVYVRNNYRKPIFLRVNGNEIKDMLPTGRQMLLGNLQDLKKLEIKTEGSLMYSTLNKEADQAKRCASNCHAWINIPDTSNPFGWGEEKAECVPFRNNFTDLDVQFLLNKITADQFLQALKQQGNPYDRFMNYTHIYETLSKIGPQCLQTIKKELEKWRAEHPTNQSSLAENAYFFYVFATDQINYYRGCRQ